MQSTTTTPSRKHSSREIAERARSYQRRVKAASLDNETMPDDMDEFRRQLTRHICMFLNQWHGCPESLCQRNRGCMAPNNNCANLPPPSAEEMEREWPRVKVELHKTLQAYLAAHGVQEDE